MTGRIRGFLGHSAVYMAANVLQRGLSFLLIPLYAAHFSTAEFGAMDLLFQLVLTLFLVTSLALPQGLVRGFHPPVEASAPSAPLGEGDRRRLLGSLASLLLPIALTMTAGLVLGAAPLARALFRGEGDAGWVRLAALLYLAMVLQQLPLQVHRTEQRSAAFAGWSLACFLLIATGNLYFIVHLHMGLPGMLWGNLLGVAGTAVPMLFLMLPRLRFNLDWRLLAPLFAYALPLLPNLLCRKLVELGSRYLLPHWHGLAEAGLFAMAARTASILEVLLLWPFLSAWHPFLYAQAGKPGAPATLARITHYFLFALLCILLGLQAFREPILAFLGQGKFAAAGPAASWLALAMAFAGLQYCVSAGFHLGRGLGREMALMVAATALNFLLVLLLAPHYGAAGAAAATALAFGFFLASSFLLAQRLYPVPYLWGRAAAVVLPAAAACAAMGAVASPAARAALLLAFLATAGLDLWRHGELGRAAAFAAEKAYGLGRVLAGRG